MCAAYGDRAAVGIHVDTHGSSLGEDEMHFALNATLGCREFIATRILVCLRWHDEEAVVLLGFLMSLEKK